MKLKFILDYVHNKCTVQRISAFATLLVSIILLFTGMNIDSANQDKIARQQKQKKIVEQTVANYKKALEEVEVAEEEPTEPYTPDYIYVEEPEEKTMYVDTGSCHNLNVRQFPNANSEVIGKLENGSEVIVVAEVSEYTSFVRINFNGENAYIHSKYISDTQPEIVTYAPVVKSSSKKKKTSSTEYIPQTTEYIANTTEYNQGSGLVLNSQNGAIQGPSGKETYYNLNMNRIVQGLKNMGVPGEYWVREDGCKMYGEFIMVAANLQVHPRGSLVQTSRGIGISCDTGGFAKHNPTQIDIATTW